MTDNGVEVLAHNVDQLRIEIDQGKTGDKAPFSDPAAAPLGTDDEAGGHPPTPQELQLASARRAPKVHRSIQGFAWPYLAIGGLLSATILAVVYFTAP